MKMTRSEPYDIRTVDIREIAGFSYSTPQGVVVIMPCTDLDEGMKTAQILARRAGLPCGILIVHDSLRLGFIKTVNETFVRISARYTVYLAQDAFPCRDWLKCAWETLEKTGKGLLAFNDGKWKGRIAAFGMARNSWVKTLYQGDFFYPAYISHGADNELTVIARAQDQHVYNPDCTLMEIDPEKDAGGSNPKDRKLFQSRFLEGFEGLVPLDKLERLAPEYKVPWRPSRSDPHRGVSVVVLFDKGAVALEALLDRFFNYNTHAPVELIVIDRGLENKAAEAVSRFAGRGFIRVVRVGDSASFANAMALGVQKARYPWLLFLKPGAPYPWDVLPSALARLQSSPARAAGVRLSHDLKSLVLEKECSESGLNQFEFFLCHKKVFTGLGRPDKIRGSSGNDARVEKQRYPASSAFPALGFFPDMAAPKGISVFLYTDGNLEGLRRALISLKRYTDLRCNTLFVIDDSQDSYVAEKIGEWTGDLDFYERVTHRDKKGFWPALLELFKEITQGDVCVLSDRAVATPQWLDGLKEAAYSDQRIGLVSPVTPSHPLYAFSMNPGDNLITCARKLSLASARQYPIIPLPDPHVFYVKHAALRQVPWPEFRPESGASYLFTYASKLLASNYYCILADDVFVFVSGPRAYGLNRENGVCIQTGGASAGRDYAHLQKFNVSSLVSLKNYAESDLRLDMEKTLAIFFHGINLGGGALVLADFCNDLVLRGWNLVAVLLNPRQRGGEFFDFLFEPYPWEDASRLSARLSRRGFLMATFWKTARPVDQVLRLNPGHIPFYFIQDFEALFYPPEGRPEAPEEKDYHRQAAETYRLGFHHLVTSGWVGEKIRVFLGKPGHPVYKIRIGVNPERIYPATDLRRGGAPLRLIAMARPRTPRRGFSDLIAALSLVCEQKPDMEIILYGTADLSGFDIPFSFCNLGVVTPASLRHHYSRADIYIDTSLFQGFGLTGLEAMACGCACVLTESGGTAEYAVDQENALLVPSGDVVAQAEAVLRLVHDETLRTTLAANAVKTAQKFNIHHAAEDFEAIAESLAASERAQLPGPGANGPTIIVPIYNQLSAVRTCLESVAAHTDPPYRVILVDDASDDHTAAWLRRFAAGHSRFTVLRNPVNLGFVGSVNAGMKASETGDLVLLNSDTLVTPGWLSGLVRCAQSDPAIGVISPLTTRSSHLWIAPNPGETVFETAQHIRRVSPSEYPDVVTPEGWCYYIKREVYERIGGFDPVYGRGYCEESDYAMRALANGWRTVCCDDTFIFHEGVVTFREQRGPRYKENRKIFDQRWKPFYEKRYQGFLACNPLGRLRRRYRSLTPEGFYDPARFSSQAYRPVLEMIFEMASDAVIHEYRRQLQDPGFRPRLWAKTEGKPKSVVFIIQQMESYGGVLSVISLANDLIRMGLSVKVVVLTPKNYQEFSGLLTRPIYFKDPAALAAHFPEADVVVATLWTTVYVMAAVFARRPDFLPVYFVQDFEPDFYPVEEAEIREKIARTYHLAPFAFAKTPWLCEKIRALGVPIAQVPPALDLELFYPKNVSKDVSGPKKILTLLRPKTPQRGFDTAVRVLKRLCRARKDIEIHAFGCNDQELRKHALPFPLINHGVVANAQLPELYAQAHVFAEFSNFHGFGRTIAEAMACGCACAITDSGGVSLFAQHEKNALIGPPGDVDALFSLIMRLCDDEGLRRRLAAVARNGVLQFDHMDSAAKTLEFFSQCLAGFAPSSPS